MVEIPTAVALAVTENRDEDEEERKSHEEMKAYLDLYGLTNETLAADEHPTASCKTFQTTPHTAHQSLLNRTKTDQVIRQRVALKKSQANEFTQQINVHFPQLMLKKDSEASRQLKLLTRNINQNSTIFTGRSLSRANLLH